MNTGLVLISLAMLVVGALIVWRFRHSDFKEKLAPGGAMAFGLLLLLCGAITMVFGFN